LDLQRLWPLYSLPPISSTGFARSGFPWEFGRESWAACGTVRDWRQPERAVCRRAGVCRRSLFRISDTHLLLPEERGCYLVKRVSKWNGPMTPATMPGRLGAAVCATQRKELRKWDSERPCLPVCGTRRPTRAIQVTTEFDATTRLGLSLECRRSPRAQSEIKLANFRQQTADVGKPTRIRSSRGHLQAHGLVQATASWKIRNRAKPILCLRRNAEVRGLENAGRPKWEARWQAKKRRPDNSWKARFRRTTN